MSEAPKQNRRTTTTTRDIARNEDDVDDNQPTKNGGFIDTVHGWLNPNRYATRKSVAQGFLNLGLLTANASQLKYILTLGNNYQFYSLMLYMILSSIGLQVLHAILILALSTMYDINKEKHQRGANILNNILVGITIVTVVINVIISAFDIRDTGYHVHAILNATKPV